MKTKHSYFCYFFSFPKIPICCFSLLSFLSTLAFFVFLYFSVPQFYALLKPFSLIFSLLLQLWSLKRYFFLFWKNPNISILTYIISCFPLKWYIQEKLCLIAVISWQIQGHRFKSGLHSHWKPNLRNYSFNYTEYYDKMVQNLKTTPKMGCGE